MCFTLIPAESCPANSRGRDGSRASPEVCLFSQSHFLPSPDILTPSEVSQLFQGINDGSGSPYLTFTAQAACFVVVLSAWLSGKGFRQSPCCSPTCACVLQISASILCIYGCPTGWDILVIPPFTQMLFTWDSLSWFSLDRRERKG